MSTNKRESDPWEESAIWPEALPWHEPVRNRITELLSDEKLPHALLLSGAPGWGERGLANWIALHMLGQPTEQIARDLAHPDIRWIAPDGAVTKIDAVREVNEFSIGTAQIARRKVAVIEAAHTLNRNSANALLKTLEEPPENTYLLLATCYPGRLLATIRSRCQRFEVSAREALARSWLAGRIDDPDLEERLFEHGGAPLAVLQGHHDGEVALVSLLGEIVRAAHPASYVERLLKVDPVTLTGRWFRYAQAHVAGTVRIPELEAAPATSVFQFVDELLWARRQLETTNSANPRLVLERLLVRWQALGRSN